MRAQRRAGRRLIAAHAEEYAEIHQRIAARLGIASRGPQNLEVWG